MKFNFSINLSGYQQEELAEMISELPTPSGNERICNAELCCNVPFSDV